ncbi:MAG: dethiobiotin synthase [Planctomycetota bacterium]
MSARMLFVTATDTEAGKTAVASALAVLLRRRGRDVGVMKPFASGCSDADGELVSADGLCLARAAGAGDPHELICPIRLRHPLAPMAAAELAGQELDLSVVRAAIDRLAASHDCLIVEGIGGIMVPITPHYRVADFAAELKAPVLIVARAGLGTINHSLLTVDAVRSRGLDVAAVLLNSPVESAGGLAEETNRGVIARLSGVPVLGPLPHCRGVSVETGELGGLPDMLAALDGVDGLIANYLEA